MTINGLAICLMIAWLAFCFPLIWARRWFVAALSIAFPFVSAAQTTCVVHSVDGNGTVTFYPLGYLYTFTADPHIPAGTQVAVSVQSDWKTSSTSGMIVKGNAQNPGFATFNATGSYYTLHQDYSYRGQNNVPPAVPARCLFSPDWTDDPPRMSRTLTVQSASPGYKLIGGVDVTTIQRNRLSGGSSLPSGAASLNVTTSWHLTSTVTTTGTWEFDIGSGNVPVSLKINGSVVGNATPGSTGSIIRHDVKGGDLWQWVDINGNVLASGYVVPVHIGDNAYIYVAPKLTTVSIATPTPTPTPEPTPTPTPRPTPTPEPTPTPQPTPPPTPTPPTVTPPPYVPPTSPPSPPPGGTPPTGTPPTAPPVGTPGPTPRPGSSPGPVSTPFYPGPVPFVGQNQSQTDIYEAVHAALNNAGKSGISSVPSVPEVDLGTTDEAEIKERELLEAATDAGEKKWDGFMSIVGKVSAVDPNRMRLSLGQRSELPLGSVSAGAAGQLPVVLNYGPFAPWVGTIRALLLAGLALATVAAILTILKGAT